MTALLASVRSSEEALDAVQAGAELIDLKEPGSGALGATWYDLRDAANLPLVAALSANHLAVLVFPATLCRLYVARDRDAAGDAVTATLTERARASGIEAIGLSPTLGDFNEDLRHFGLDDLRAALRVQLVPEDVARFMIATEEAEMRA